MTRLPEDKNAVRGRWVFTVKDNVDGTETYKARYVAKGYSQEACIDYKETFPPTASMTSVHNLMQEATQYDNTLSGQQKKSCHQKEVTLIFC